VTEDLHNELTDSIVLAFLRDTEDIKVEIVIDWVEDLGIRVMVVSDGDASFARAGSPDSVTDAINKLIAKAVPKIEKHRADRAQIEAAYEAAMNDEDDE
jgi:hypothetical protein